MNMKQAQATISILEIVRWVAVGIMVIGALVWGLIGVFGLFQEEVGLALMSFAGVIGLLIYAAITYAIIGWFVETLRLLKTIADNTARP